MQLLFVHALSPVHAGTGLSEGAIELAIARDQASGHPYIPGSSIKGTLRDRARSQPPPLRHALFGPETNNASDHAGALVFGDANLLLLPVRSIAGTFAWVTSPYLLRRFARDCAEAGLTAPPLAFAMPASVKECLVPRTRAIVVPGDRVIFEDLDLDAAIRVAGTVDHVGKVAAWLAARIFPDRDDAPWIEFLTARLCIVHDDVMTFFSRHAMDVVARVALKHDSKTVDNLWHEESLPTESVLVAAIAALPNSGSTEGGRRLAPKDLLDTLAAIIRPAQGDPGVVQLGGKSTVGRGRCRLTLVGAQP